MAMQQTALSIMIAPDDLNLYSINYVCKYVAVSHIS